MAFDPYQSWLGVSLEGGPPTYYELLGLAPFESDREVIEQAALRRMSKVRQYQIGPLSDQSQEVLALLARARLVLIDPDRRAEYDAKLRALGEGHPALPEAAAPDTSEAPCQPVEIAGHSAADLVLAPIPRIECDDPLTSTLMARRSTALWKKRLIAAAIVGSHVVLIWAFFAFGMLPIGKWIEPLRVTTEPLDRPPLDPKPTDARPSPEIARLSFDGRMCVAVAESRDFDMTNRDYTIFARINTRRGGTIFSKTAADGPWHPDGKSLFVRDGRLVFDIGWVDYVESGRQINDGRWHEVAMTYARKRRWVSLYIDGKLDNQRMLGPKQDAPQHVVRIGYTAPGLPCQQNYFRGWISEVRFYQRTLTEQEIAALSLRNKEPTGEKPVARWVLGQPVDGLIKDATGHQHTGTVEVEEPASAQGTLVEGSGGRLGPADGGRGKPEGGMLQGNGADLRRAKDEASQNDQDAARNQETPEQVLERHGLSRAGSLYVLESETDVSDAAQETWRLASELKFAQMQEHRAPTREGRDQLIKKLESENKLLEFEIANADRELRDPKFQQSRAGSFANTVIAEEYHELLAFRNRRQSDLDQQRTYVSSLRNQPSGSQAKQSAEALVEARQAAYKRSAERFGELVQQTKQAYEELAENHEIKTALAALGRSTKAKPRLRTAREFDSIAKSLAGVRRKRR